MFSFKQPLVQFRLNLWDFVSNRQRNSGQKPWSQVASLPPGINMSSFLSHRGFSIPSARRLLSNFANSSSRAFCDTRNTCVRCNMPCRPFHYCFVDGGIVFMLLRRGWDGSEGELMPQLVPKRGQGRVVAW